MNCVHVRLLPGLRRSWLPASVVATEFRVLRRFHSSFPPHPASLMATLATGQPPSVHGIFGHEQLEGGRVQLPTPARGVELTRDDRWPGVTRVDESSWRGTEQLWRQELETNPQGLWILIGAPSVATASRFVDPVELLPAGTTHRAEGGVLRVARELSPDERDALLRREGIERVLFGEGRARRGCAHDEAGKCVVLAAGGVTFREGDLLYGSDEECWVAVVGEGAEERCRRWPNAVHDLRIAPTVASWLGRTAGAYADKPLP